MFAGLVTVSFVLEATFSLVPGLAPNRTWEILVNPLPVIVTGVPPAAAPVTGLIVDTLGGAMNVNRSFDVLAEVPYGVISRTSTRPGERFGAVRVTDFSEFTLMLLAAVEPNKILVTSTKPEPLIVTWVPPLADPVVADSLVIFGAGTYRNRAWLVTVLVPDGLVAFTVTVPEPFGATTATWVSDSTLILVAGRLPNITLLTPDRPTPVNVTTVPPPALPAAGDTPVTDGNTAATAAPAGTHTRPASGNTSATTTPSTRRPSTNTPTPPQQNPIKALSTSQECGHADASTEPLPRT